MQHFTPAEPAPRIRAAPLRAQLDKPDPSWHIQAMGEALIFLVVTAAAIWLVADGLKAREAAITGARHLCATEGLQFLDDSVAQSGMRIVRAPRGPLALQRTYAFEFSDTGNNRQAGQITVIGGSVTMTYTGLRAVTAPAPEPDQIG